MRGFGTVVTGTLTSGTLRADDELVVLPAGRRVKVRGLQVHGAAQPSAAAGRRVAVNLGGVEVADLTRGDTLTSPDAFEVTRRFDAVIDLLPDARPLRHGARVRFHTAPRNCSGGWRWRRRPRNARIDSAGHTDVMPRKARERIGNQVRRGSPNCRRGGGRSRGCGSRRRRC